MGTQLSRLFAILLLASVSGHAWAQGRFEVTSVKPSHSGATAQDARFNTPGDRFEVTAATVGDIIDMLNGFRLYHVVDGPAWMRIDRFDIVAKADRPVAEPDSRPAVMGLLAERFQLQTHNETRAIPGFMIRASKAPGTLSKRPGFAWKASHRLRRASIPKEVTVVDRRERPGED